MDIITERTIALAGVVQACHEVQSLAREGYADHQSYENCIKSILVLDAVNTPAVFGGIDGVKKGLSLLADGVMQSTSTSSLEVLRYTMSILQLQNQLYRDSSAFNSFASEIERLSAVDQEGMAEACSEIYQKYISVMQPQVIVQGEEHHLQKDDVPPQIRALLLAGLRAAVLWQQKGGSRFRLIWERTRMRNAARNLLSQR